MIDEALLISGEGNRYRLRDEDLVLHAASHLLLNSEFDTGLRDLWDIDILLRHFSTITPDFYQHLLNRADSVGLGKIARRALSLCQRYFATPMPKHALVKGGLRYGVTRKGNEYAPSRYKTCWAGSGRRATVAQGVVPEVADEPFSQTSLAQGGKSFRTEAS